MKMNKDEALRIILNSAKKYKSNLVNNNILIIFYNKEKRVNKSFETLFLPMHFEHLTGVDIVNPKIKSSVQFYEMSIDERLGLDDFELKSNGDTELKLKVLLSLMDIHKISKMVTDYNHSKPKLYTEKLSGNVNGCLGFVMDKGYYVPNTALNEDIRALGDKKQKVMLVLTKKIKDKLYSNISYKTKDVILEDIIISKEILAKIDTDHLKTMFNLTDIVAKPIMQEIKDKEIVNSEIIELDI